MMARRIAALFFSREYFLVNRVALVFKGIKRTILLSDCIHSFIDFAGWEDCKEAGGKKKIGDGQRERVYVRR